ncbi:MAG: creatininase family protein [Candidatus Hydrothermarchaeales archaeon]
MTVKRPLNLNDLTWVEVKRYLERRKDILLPFGSVEEHGYHLPLSTDGDIALGIAEELSAKTGVVIAPLIWYGVSNTTRGYVGTTMVGFDTLKAYCGDILAGLKESGFEIVYIISGHFSGSQTSAIKEAARSIDDLECYLLDFSRIDTSDILETQPFHACEAETSLMLYLHPQKVDMDKAVDEKIVSRKFAIKGGIEKTDSGVFGSPTKATREKGEKLFERITDELTAFILSKQKV